jgi:TatD DNase family protein
MNAENIKLFDTHAHFSRASENYTIADQIERAHAAGVSRITAVGGSDELNSVALQATELFPQTISATLGLDRDCAAELHQTARIDHEVNNLRTEIRTRQQDGTNICGIGEIGLDYHYSPDSALAQQELFRAQLQLAAELQLPVVVHSREADSDTLEALTEYATMRSGIPGELGVLHCFTGSQAFAEKLLDLGFLISFSGIVTFLNADPLREVAKTIPADKLLLETDSPYLAPAPMRGNRNEPAFVLHVANRLAEVRKELPRDVAEQTFANACRLFNLA